MSTTQGAMKDHCELGSQKDERSQTCFLNNSCQEISTLRWIPNDLKNSHWVLPLKGSIAFHITTMGTELPQISPRGDKAHAIHNNGLI